MQKFPLKIPYVTKKRQRNLSDLWMVENSVTSMPTCALSRKRRPQSGERGCLSSADIFRKGGGRVLQMRTSALFDAKNIGFLKFMVCQHGQRGLSQCGHFVDKGRGGQIFAILCGRLLWTAPLYSFQTVLCAIKTIPKAEKTVSFS